MDFKEFTTRAEQDIRAALEDASPGVGVGMNQVEKLQGESYTAITLTPEGTNIGMNLNLNQLYDRMQQGESYDSVLQAAVDQAKEHLSNMPRFDVAELSSYETAKDLLFVDVVGTKVNAEMLAKVPHTDMEDISMVYRMQLEQLSDGAATVLITNDLMNRMGVTKEQLHADAMANSEVVRPASMRTMAEVMAQMMGKRTTDNIELHVECTESGLVHVILKDVEPRKMTVPGGIEIPILPGEVCNRITYDGRILTWPNDITEDEIDSFCSLFKTRESRGREQSEEKRKYAALKSMLDQEQRSYESPKETRFIIIPTAVEVSSENRSTFKQAMERVAHRMHEEFEASQIIVAMPVCNESEQKLTEYAKTYQQEISLLPITMFDINSFRRIQNVLYREILKLGKATCPSCGGMMRQRDNQCVCDSCSQLMLTRTICPNPECRKEYLYMSYDKRN